MKIIKPGIELIWITPNPLQVIERMGRLAYKSEDKIGPGSAEPFIKRIMDRGHESVIEHACASFIVTTDRGISHELVRHRICSYTQSSTRYCNYSLGKFGSEIQVIEPPGLGPGAFDVWQLAIQQAEDNYLNLIDLGEAPQIARSVLPTCLKTELGMTANFRQWRHIFKMRTAKGAHPQAQEIANMLLARLKSEVSAIFDDL